MEKTRLDQTGDGFSPHRVVTGAAILIAAGLIYEAAWRRSLAGAISLTGAGVVAIINFRWLEALLMRVVQPGRPKFDCGSILRLVSRMVLLASVLGALLWVPRIDGVAVILGFSALVFALLVEGFRWGRMGVG